MRFVKVLVVAVVAVACASASAGTAGAADAPHAPWGYRGGTLTGGGSHGMSLGPTPQSAPLGAHVDYLGGPVVSHASIESVFWGNGTYESGVGPGQLPITEFFEGVTDSAYMDWLSEYDTTNQVRLHDLPPQSIGRGSYQGQTTISPAIPSGTITDVDIDNEIVRQIESGAVPPPQIDSNGMVRTVYALFFPASVTISSTSIGTGGEPGGFCAYHTTTLANGVPVPYMVLPDFETHHFANGCGTDPVLFNNFTATTSHEIVETITDPFVGLVDSTTQQQVVSWRNLVTGEEIADICQDEPLGTVLGGNGLTHVVQQEFSQSANGGIGDCVVSRAGVPTPPRNGYVNACGLAGRNGFTDAGLAGDCLEQYGIALGKNDGTFGEDDGLIRSQVSSLLARLVSLSGGSLPTTRSFPDVTGLADTQVRQEIEQLAGAGIIAGFPDGTFHPNDHLSVAQAATLVMRTLAFIHTSNPTAPNFSDQGSTGANYLVAVSNGLLDVFASNIRGFSYAMGPGDVTARGLLADVLAQGVQRLVDTNTISRA